jgi:hypothetical protein
MPFKSKAQERLFYALEREGKISKGTVEEWQSKTHGKLPEHKKDASDADRQDPEVGVGLVPAVAGDPGSASDG